MHKKTINKIKKQRKTRRWDNQKNPCFCEGVAFTETRLMPVFRVSTGLHVEHRRPKAGDASHQGLLKVERRGFKVKGLGL